MSLEVLLLDLPQQRLGLCVREDKRMDNLRLTDKRREVRRRDHRQLLRQASPSHCDGHRDGGERYGVRGDVWGLDDDVSWGRDALVQDGALLFDVLERVLARELYLRAEQPSRARRELRRQEREP
jgi:hypothetical protein